MMSTGARAGNGHVSSAAVMASARTPNEPRSMRDDEPRVRRSPKKAAATTIVRVPIAPTMIAKPAVMPRTAIISTENDGVMPMPMALIVVERKNRLSSGVRSVAAVSAAGGTTTTPG